MLRLFLAYALLFSSFSLFAQPTRQDTLKGSITPERKWWDVLHYDLTIRPDYLTRTVTGRNIIEYRVVGPGHHPAEMQIDLQDPLVIDSAFVEGRRLALRKDGNAWFAKMPSGPSGSVQRVTLYYSGKPRESVHAPWDGGLIWTKDSLGRPWMAVACQLIGSSVWYPCKVHLSDEPDNGATISVVVPDTLVGVSNGRLQKRLANGDGTTTWRWVVVDPINNYGITFYIGKYVPVPDSLHGEKGVLPMHYWVLDYSKVRAETYLSGEVHRTLPAFESWFGPYPFYEDGFKMVEAPYIGMEHQSAVGYGNHFMLGRFGAKRLTPWDWKVDRMVTHENAHEWFGNSITAKDPADRWLQEGFAACAEELAVESFYGRKAAEEFYHDRTRHGGDSLWINDKPVISEYNIFKDAGDGMYLQGWELIHMIRAIVNDDVKFRKLLRGLSAEFYHQTVTSAQVEQYISRASGFDFSRLFDQYLRTAGLPVLEYSLEGNFLSYRLAQCLPGLTIPLKTHWTGDKWLYTTTSWQEVMLHGPPPEDDLQIDYDFYLPASKTRRK